MRAQIPRVLRPRIEGNRRFLHEHRYVVACGLWSPHINGLAVPLWSPQYQTFVVVTIGLLSAMFTMFTIIFVGASMTDPEIRLLLGYIADAFAPNAGPSHYALMSEEDITQVEKDRWIKDLNVQLIPVSKAGNYAETTEFLQVLAAVP